MDTQISEFGYLLRQHRKRVGLSQRELAKRIGVDNSYISRLERGERDVSSRDKIIMMIEVMNLSDHDANSLLLTAGFAPINENMPLIGDPVLGLIADIIHDERITEAELSTLKEYAQLLDRLRQQR